MDGQAKDFVISVDGNLVPTDAEWCRSHGLRSAVMITEEATGEVSMEIWGEPSHELRVALTQMLGHAAVIGN